MQTISHDIKNELIIKKSKFICHLYKVNSINDINYYLDLVNNKYKDATHNCYAYICDNLKKYSDDGEPSGTAGMPMLNILEMNQLDHILVIITRYFGGVKLGANGLVRAYSNSVKEALNLAHIITLTEGYLINIEFSYDKIKMIDYILKNNNIIYKDFKDNIIYQFEIACNKNEQLKEIQNTVINYQIIKKVLIADVTNN